jgi:hypothetical protein
MGLKSASGLFQELYDMLRNEVRKDPELQNQIGASLDMTEGEKRISFLNRWMVFKKVRDVDAEEVSRTLLGQSLKEIVAAERETEDATEAVTEVVVETKPKVKPRKLKRRIKLVMSEKSV